MIAIYQRGATYDPSLEKLRIRSRQRSGWLDIRWLLYSSMCQNFDKVRLKFSVMAPCTTIFPTIPLAAWVTPIISTIITATRHPRPKKCKPMLGMLHKQLWMKWNVQKKDMLRHNSGLPLLGLWNPLAMILVKNDWNLRRKSIIIVISYFVILSLQIMLLDLFPLVIVQKW